MKFHNKHTNAQNRGLKAYQKTYTRRPCFWLFNLGFALGCLTLGGLDLVVAFAFLDLGVALNFLSLAFWPGPWGGLRYPCPWGGLGFLDPKTLLLFTLKLNT
ncbi:hypothetical protein CsSME_00011665 [Camellia sinensis var. sinensis]